MVECTGLENRRGGNSTVGSNPTSSANAALTLSVCGSDTVLELDRLPGRAENPVRAIESGRTWLATMPVPATDIGRHQGS